jgi:N-dimethylarginine dimethylaminohydrolase
VPSSCRRHGLRRPVPVSQRAAEAAAHQLFYAAGPWTFADPVHVNEGEGDFAYLPGAYGGLILAGHGFRTDPAAHAEAQEVLAGR